MRAVDIIRAKRDGEPLSREAIEAFVGGVAAGDWPDYQTSALLMAIVLRGMSPQETSWLTDAMVRSGRRVDLSSLPGRKVGKHSTGGVGDKVSIALAPLVAACGVTVPKMSGRGLGHTGGTLDKLESIPGFRVALSLDEFRAVLREAGCCLMGQTEDVAPADKQLYALRDVTGTIESIPLISASVMSKKIAEGSDALVLDVKCGQGAFMKSRADARALARSLVRIGEAQGVTTEAFITAMDAPLGRAIGNALEIAECCELLAGRGPADLRDLVLRLAARMVRLGGGAKTDRAAAQAVKDALASGAARARLRQMVACQGGDPAVVDDPSRLPAARERVVVAAPANGYVAALDAERLGHAAAVLGAGRDVVGAPIDHAVGVRLLKTVGDRVQAGEGVVELHVNERRRLPDAEALAREALRIRPRPPARRPLVLDWVHAKGEKSFT